MIKICLLVVCFVQILSYLEVQLTETIVGNQAAYTIQVEIQKTKYKLRLNLEKQTEYLNPPKNAKALKKDSQITAILAGHSLEQNNNIQGWRRYFSEAFFFIEQRYNHKFELELDWMEIKKNGSSISNGIISLSPSIIDNRFFNEIKKDYPHINIDVFAIYLGASNSKNTIQFGGYQITYAYQTIAGHFHRAQIQNNEKQWILKVPKLLLSKDDHGKYADFVLTPEQFGLKLSISHNKLFITQEIVKVLLIALQSQNITCKFQTILTCSNMTSLDLSLHQFVFPVNDDFSVNISLYRLLNQCDKKFEHCSFNVEIRDRFQIGSVFFKDHYTVFNMEQKHLLIGLNNKYPSEWFSTVYIIRGLIILIILMFVTALFVGSSQNIPFFKRRKNEDIQGIQLVSHQQLHQY